MGPKEILFVATLAIPGCQETPFKPISVHCEQVGNDVRNTALEPMHQTDIWLASLVRIAEEARTLAIEQCTKGETEQ